jgi:two-component system, cell cycle sensor histidine kinase and response regulator CckA
MTHDSFRRFAPPSTSAKSMRFLLAIAKSEIRTQVKNELKTAFPDCRFFEGHEGHTIGPTEFDIAIVDDLPDLTFATKRLTHFSQAHPGQPVIVILETCDVDVSLNFMKAGAADLVFHREVKDRLVSSIRESLQRNQAFERLQRKRRLESMATLVGGIAHDLNNALSPIKLALDMLPKVKDPKQISFITTTLRSSVERGAAMIRQLQTFANGQECDRHSLSIRDVIHEVESNVRQHLGSNIDFKIALASGLGRVLGDFSQLVQVLRTLVANAIEAMPNGGRLTIGAQNASLQEGDSSRGLKPGEYIHLQIIDTGVGIAPSICGKVIDPFFTTKETGSGLGLATSYGIIRAHGGYLEVAAERQGGANASIFLPCQEVEPEKEEPSSLRCRGAGQAILVIDRDEPVRQMIAAALEEHGYKAIPMHCLPENEPHYSIHSYPIRLAIVDLDGQGREYLDKVKGLAPHEPALPIVGTRAKDIDGLENGFIFQSVPVLQKPFTTGELLQVVEDSLGDHVARKEYCNAP